MEESKYTAPAVFPAVTVVPGAKWTGGKNDGMGRLGYWQKRSYEEEATTIEE